MLAGFSFLSRISKYLCERYKIMNISLSDYNELDEEKEKQEEKLEKLSELEKSTNNIPNLKNLELSKTENKINESHIDANNSKNQLVK